MLRKWPSIIIGLVTILTFATSASAVTIKGDVLWPGQFAINAESSNLKYDDGRLYSKTPVMLVCVDKTTRPPDDGPASFSLISEYSVIRAGAGPIGVAALHWLMDTYYESFLLNGTSEQQWAFQYAVWEIGNDFDGQVSSISETAGKVIPANDDYASGSVINATDFQAAYEEIYSALRAALPTLSPGFKTTKYYLDFVANNLPGAQDMMVVLSNPPERRPVVAVPLDMPVALMSVLMGVLAVGVRRKARQSAKPQA